MNWIQRWFRSRRYPDTGFQYAVVEELSSRSVLAGRDLREGVATRLGVKRSIPSFYLSMARMEDEGLVRGWYRTQLIDGVLTRQRRYRLTIKAMNGVRD